MDINRFYGSIYSHSIPWAALGKTEALKQHKAKTLDKHWSSELDRLVRACNRNQTIGIPIGPDTSRVVSELVLSRIDHELKKNGSGLKKRQVAPLFVGLKGGDALNQAQKRMLRWGVQECSRRHDIVSLLWFLYLHLQFDLKLTKTLKKLCFEVESVLVDLMLAHADHNALLKGGFAEALGRYQNMGLSSSGWLFLYETEARGWKSAAGVNKIGQSGDPKNFFKLMKDNDVHFYDVAAFGVSAFPWSLVENDFNPEEDDDEAWLDFDELEAEDDENEQFFIY